MDNCTEISVLGPIEVAGPRGREPVGGLRARRFLGLLAVELGRAVPIDRILEVVWPDRRPPGVSGVHSIATRVRALVGADAIALEDHSYALAVPPSIVDAVRFEDAVIGAAAEVDHDPEAALATANDALSMWRGQPYGELAGDDPFRLEAIRLTELRYAGCETVAAGALAAGLGERAIMAAEQLTSEVPYRDRGWQLLVEALWTSGRRVEAQMARERCAAVMASAGFSAPELPLSECR